MSYYRRDLIEQELQHLNDEIQQLREERDFLKELIESRDNVGKISEPMFRDAPKQKIWYRQYRVGHYDKEYLRNLPDFHEKWKNSYYYRHQEECEANITGSFNPITLNSRIKRASVNPFRDRKRPSCSITVVCELTCVQNNNKTLLLTDAYDEKVTKPVTEEIYNIAVACVGQMVKATLQFELDNPYPNITTLSPLPYTMYTDLAL